MNPTSRSVTKPSTFGNQVITQAIAFFCFFVMPTVITLLVPFTNLEIRNTESGTTATVNRFVLTFIPWRTEHVQNVTQIRADIKATSYKQTDAERRRKEKSVKVATGQLAIVNQGPEVIVQAAPELAKKIAAQFDQFVTSKSSEPLNISVYASWPLSYLLGGAATALCGFYVICVALAILVFPFKWMRSFSKEAPIT